MLKNDTLLDIYMLKDVIRYNCRKHLKDESVAEHSFYVALMALMICEEKNINDNDIIRKAIIKALLHDMPEIEFNDITHNVKEKLNLTAYLKKYEDEYYAEKFPAYADLMSNDDDNIVNRIVLFADALSVKQFCLNELALGNNSKDISDEILKNAEHRCKEHEKRLDALIAILNRPHDFD